MVPLESLNIEFQLELGPSAPDPVCRARLAPSKAGSAPLYQSDPTCTDAGGSCLSSADGAAGNGGG